MEMRTEILVSGFIYSFIYRIVMAGKEISPEMTFVYGPALNPRIVLPARYFYVHAVDIDGNNFTQSPGFHAFELQLTTTKSNPVRANQKLFDRHDGSFLFVFQVKIRYKGLVIIVKHDGKHVGDSPYVFPEMIYGENCYCPQQDENDWLTNMSCDTVHPQIEKDLKPFPHIDLDVLYQKASLRFRHTRTYSACYYSIIDNQIYKKCFSKLVPYAKYVDNWLLSLSRKVKLPDIEFFMNLADWPLAQMNANDTLFPVFSWCGSNDTYDIVMPTYDLTESTLEVFGRKEVNTLSVQGNTGPPWRNKIPKVFFRGRDSHVGRLKLIERAFLNEHDFDVGITLFQSRKYEELYGYAAKRRIHFFKFFQYKYQLNMDGWVAAYRLPYLLLGNSVVLKQNSPYYEHFYGDLVPMMHYVPIEHDLSNLEEQVNWTKTNDEQAQQIGLNGQRYVRENLTSHKLYCYSYRLFQEYAKRLTQKPKTRDDMEHISQQGSYKCGCTREDKSTGIHQKSTVVKQVRADL